MGNALGRRKHAKVLKVSGETLRVKTPATAKQVTEGLPEHVLFAWDAVKEKGIHAKPLEPEEELRPKKAYFLMERPKFPNEDTNPSARRVRSGITRGAKERLETLMISRRTASDISFARNPLTAENEPVRLKMRLTRAELNTLISESPNNIELEMKVDKMEAAGSRSRRRTVKWKH